MKRNSINVEYLFVFLWTIILVSIDLFNIDKVERLLDILVLFVAVLLATIVYCGIGILIVLIIKLLTKNLL